MKFRIISFIILVFLLFASPGSLLAQLPKKNSADSAKAARARTDSVAKARKKETENRINARKNALDSIKNVRAHALDSATRARARKTDSLKDSREHKTDSLTRARKRVTDSTAAIKKYKESKKYRDSVTRSKNVKTKAVQDKRQARMDSIQQVRKRTTDSIALVRTTRTDSIKARQKTRTDSLTMVKKYKASKRYSDSVLLTRRHRMDSIKAIQKGYRDSIASVRKRSLDSAKKVRTHIMDSTKLVRTKIMDSIKAVRKSKTDSLAKKKEGKEKLAKVNEKKKLDALKLKIDLKQKKEREAWSNQTMLKKNWGPKRRLTQNSFTHYNYYFNANRKMDEAELNMRRVSKENYDSLIGLFPYDPNKDSALFAADMDSIIRKVSVGIQIHDPRIKWSNDMYLLLGQAFYYKGNYENAATAFRYIIASDQKSKNKKGKSGNSYTKSKSAPSIVEKKKKSKLAFLQHKSVHNDAILWLARTYNTAGQIENGESVLSLLEYDDNLPEELVGKLHVEKAFAYLKLRNYPEASRQLSEAITDDNLPEWLRLRIAFLNGQLQMNNGDYVAAAENFEEVLNHYPKIDMDFYARKMIAYNKLMAGQGIAEAMPPLKKLLTDGKYAGQYDQVYYVLGTLSVKANENEDAVAYFSKSTTTPKASKKQKSISFAALGDVYYATGRYAYAKSAYDSAAKYSSGSKDKTIAAALQRSTGLKEVSGPANTIKEQDSLLALAELSHKEQVAAARRYLRDLEKRKQDSIFNAENAATATVTEAETDKPADGPGWYFSNPTLMSQGSSDFKRKWGNRPLTDNWRRSAAQPLSDMAKADNADGSDAEEEEAVAKKENGLPTENSLLAKIPNTQPQKEQAYKVQQKAYILLAKAYFDQLDDYKEAINTLDTLNKRLPKHTQKEEELYLRYRIAVKQNKLDLATQYSTELIKKFPQSQYVSILKPKQSESKPIDENTAEVAPFFDKTYALLMDHQYTEVLMRTEEGKRKFAHPTYRKRFEITEAMAYAGSGNYVVADSLASNFIKSNPADSLTEWAKAVSAYIKDMKNGGKPSWYKEGVTYPKPVVASKETKAPAKAESATTPPSPAEPEIPKFFSYQADSEHYCILILPGLDSRTGNLKEEIKNFNTTKFAAANLELLIDMYSMSQSVVMVRKFANAAEAKIYLAEINNASALSKYKEGEVNTCIISANNYRKMFVDKSAETYKSFYTSNYNK